MRGNPSSGRIERSSPPVDSTASRNGYVGSDKNGGHRASLFASANRYLNCLGLDVEDLFRHVLATPHEPAYRGANAGALRMEWPRIPMPGWPNGGSEGAAEELSQSAAHGRELAALLDPDTPVPGVTRAPLRPDIAAIAIPATTGGRSMGARTSR